MRLIFLKDDDSLVGGCQPLITQSERAATMTNPVIVMRRLWLVLLKKKCFRLLIEGEYSQSCKRGRLHPLGTIA